MSVGDALIRPSSGEIATGLAAKAFTRGTSMATNPTAFWRRLDLFGHDAARLVRFGDGWRLEGTALFLSRRHPARLDYRVDLAADWTTIGCDVDGRLDGSEVSLSIRRNASGWIVNGEEIGLVDLEDLDLSFTPATNYPQIRRLDLAVGEAADLTVAWLEAGSSTLVPLPQRYERTGALLYRYEAPSVGYSGVLRLSEQGFVAEYPGLWVEER